MKVLTSVEFWKITAPVLTVVIGWLLNERSKRKSEQDRRSWEQYQRKESSYIKLLSSSKGFSQGIQEQQGMLLKEDFLDQLTLCWLYASDEVIRSIYRFLDTIRVTASPELQMKKDEAYAEFVAELRKDLISGEFIKETDLTARDYKLLKVTNVFRIDN
jgi:hypothetical protein